MHNFKWLEEDEAHDLAWGYFNAPNINSEFSEEDFLKEHREFIDALASELRLLGTVGLDVPTNDYDFITGYETGLTRSVVVACFRPDVYCERVIEILSKAVGNSEEERMIVLNGFFANNSEAFILCVKKEGVLGWSNLGLSSLSVFGLFA